MFAFFSFGPQEVILLAIIGFLLFGPLIALVVYFRMNNKKDE